MNNLMGYNVIKSSNPSGTDIVASDITPTEFEAIAATCTRWEKRSLDVVEALLIKHRPITEVANAHNMTVQQANVLRTRFTAKLSEHRLADFKQRVPPKGRPIRPDELQQKKADLKALQADGYTVPQLVEYLAEHNINATAAQVKKLLEGDKP